MNSNEQLFRILIEEGFSKGDARSTHKGQFGPMPPTGKKMEITVIDILRFKEGKLVEHWGVPDRFALMEQLGMKPPPKLILKLMNLSR